MFLKILILGQEIVRPPLNLPLNETSDEQVKFWKFNVYSS